VDDSPEIRWRGFKVGCPAVMHDLVKLIVDGHYLLSDGGWLISEFPNVSGFFGIDSLDDEVLINSTPDHENQ